MERFLVLLAILLTAPAHAKSLDALILPDPMKEPKSDDSGEMKYRRTVHNARAMLQLGEEKERDKASGRGRHEFEQALELGREARELKSENAWEAAVVIGLALLHSGERSEGEIELRGVLDSVPDKVRASLKKKLQDTKERSTQQLINPWVIPEKVYPAPAPRTED